MSTKVTLDQDYIKSRVYVEPNTGCWLWEKSVNSRGYGNLIIGGKGSTAHRASYRVFKGDPEGWLVCHKCDTKICVNPDHLYLGTGTDNMNDAYERNRKGKIPRKETKTMKALQQAGMSLSKIAKQYGVTKTAIFLRLKAYGNH